MMARFFFHYWDGSTYYEDEEGSDVGDTNEAFVEAFESAQQLLIERLLERRSVTQGRIDVVDEEGRLVLDVPFSEITKGSTGRPPARGQRAASEVASAIVEVRTALENMAHLLRRL